MGQYEVAIYPLLGISGGTCVAIDLSLKLILPVTGGDFRFLL